MPREHAAMSAVRVEILVDGSARFGLGHVSRMRTLARHLREEGFEVALLPASEAAADALAGEPAGHSDRPDVLLVDLPYPADARIAAARQAGLPVMVFDPLGEEEADIAIRTDPREIPLPAKQARFGPEYALIRREILAATPHEGDYALVVIGGSDQGNLGAAAAARLAERNVRTVLVRGPFAPALSNPPTGVDLRVAPDDLPELMAGCRFAVANAGTTALELMALGKAIHVLPQTAAERATAERFLADGLILGVGLQSLAPPEREAAQRVAAAARAAVDGKGPQRIRELIETLIGNREQTG